ncbi:MAG: hypothetical protein EOP51_10860, partial [Sphingobacteriales bacterium]
CAQCGKPFECTMETGHCWCFAHKLAESTLKQLSDNYADCLCADCLKQYEVGENNKTSKE